MPYTKDEMLDDFRKDVARLEAENARLRAAVKHGVRSLRDALESALRQAYAAIAPATEEPKP